VPSVLGLTAVAVPICCAIPCCTMAGATAPRGGRER
jgi:hypothetical protein